jgi:RimJ/RimL family protein N-acetyltransferase
MDVELPSGMGRIGMRLDCGAMTHPLDKDRLPVVLSRTVLRRLLPTDLREFQEYRTDPAVAKYQGWTAMTDLDAGMFLAEMHSSPLFVPGQWFQLGIALSAGALIGDIGICVDTRDPTQAEIGFSLNARWQGQGLASEGIDAARSFVSRWGEVTRLTGITDARNESSIRLLRRLGFHLEKTEAAMFRGEPCHEHHYVWDMPAS